MVTVEEIKKRYRDEWVLVEVIEEDELGQPIDVELIAHSKSRDEIYDALMETKGKYTYQFYTGEIPKKGYAVALSFLKRFKLYLDFRAGILELE